MENTANDSHFTKLRQFAKEAPLGSGVYIMKNLSGEIIYVGKAKVLRNRLSSYFTGTKDIKTATLVKHARSIETISTANEYEALLLENNLIKQHRPKYNIDLKDGKTYPVVRVTKEDFPKVHRTRRIINDGSRYFGPYANLGAIDVLLDLVERLFPLRKCRVLRPRKAPCMYWHIGRCSAPCCGKISKEEYEQHVQQVIKLLSGKTAELEKQLNNSMREAAERRDFEGAARFRDIVRALNELNASNAVVDFDPESRDYVAWISEGIMSSFVVFSMRGGKLCGRELYRTRSAASDAESLQTFLLSYYNPSRLPPPSIYTGTEDVDIPAIEAWFDKSLGCQSRIYSGKERRHEVVLAMARQNAKEDMALRQREKGSQPVLEELAYALDLPIVPQRIEGFDIAQLDGRFPVASLVHFRDGRPDKRQYRHYRLRSVDGLVDDYQAMREAVSRRYGRLVAEGGELPDFILIDGGLGQVNAAREVLDSLGLDIPLAGLAKRDEELWLPEAASPICLSKDSGALKLLQHVRDETHRFATSKNQRLRSAALKLESLESLDGIGPARAARLLKSFGSLEAIAAASAQEIASRCSLNVALAATVQATAAAALKAKAVETQRLSRGFARRASAGQQSAASLAAEALQDYSPTKLGPHSDKK